VHPTKRVNQKNYFTRRNLKGIFCRVKQNTPILLWVTTYLPKKISLEHFLIILNNKVFEKMCGVNVLKIKMFNFLIISNIFLLKKLIILFLNNLF
jgi:hypothetical protein